MRPGSNPWPLLSLLEALFLRLLQALFSLFHQITNDNVAALHGVGTEIASANLVFLDFLALIQTNNEFFWPCIAFVVNKDFRSGGEIIDSLHDAGMLVVFQPLRANRSWLVLIEELPIALTTDKLCLATLVTAGVALGAGFE